MAALIGLEPFGIQVDFPDETKTGGDMEWTFVAPQEINGGSYLTVVLQAQRAKQAKLTHGPGYWYYDHLDHGTPKGDQAQTLVSQVGSAFPLYIFYNPTSALVAKTKSLPAVEGINLVFAQHIAPVFKGGCTRGEKKIEHWRKHFLPLSDILCWPAALVARRRPVPPDDVTRLVVGRRTFALPAFTGGFHPDIVADRLNRRLDGQITPSDAQAKRIVAEPRDGIPDGIRRALAGEMSEQERKELPRPRVIFSTHLKRGDPEFATTLELSRR